MPNVVSGENLDHPVQVDYLIEGTGGYGSCCHIAFWVLSQDVDKFQQKAQNEKFCTFFPGSKAERNVQQRK